MPPRTLKTEIMRHMLNLAKDMASGDLLESRKKLEEYPLCGDPAVFDHIMRARAVQDRMWGREADDTKNDPRAGAPTSLIVPSDGCVTRINGHEKIPTTFTTP
jgi:hypothetical protein